jgi:hypothetical protein
MQLINHDITNDTYSISIVPRYFDYDIFGTIRAKTDNLESYHEFSCEILNGKMSVDLAEFIPIPDEKYELTLSGATAGLIWLGQIMYTHKDIQDYQMHNTDENNLKF